MLITTLFALLINSAAAVTLSALPEGPTSPLPVSDGSGNYPCDQILAKLAAYNTLARQHDASLEGFFSQIVNTVSAWYNLLSPLENTPQTVAVGTFDPLQDGADKISKATDAAYDNSALLSQEMDRILLSMKACVAKSIAIQ